MPAATLPRISARTAGEICRHFKLDQDAQALYQEKMPPAQFVDLLIQKGCAVDAVKFLAYALPKREAVWWACRCVRSAGGAALPAPAQKALQAAERWVADPSEANRTATLDAAQAADFATPAGCAALAAYWSGGKHAPPDAKLDPPAEAWTHHAAAGAITQAGVVAGPEKFMETLRAFLKVGLEVAGGTGLWK